VARFCGIFCSWKGEKWNFPPYIIKLIKCKPQIELNVQKCPQDERRSICVDGRVFGKRRGVPGDICFGEGELISWNSALGLA